MTSIADRITTASQLATDEIRQMIQKGVLEPDRKVSIDQLADELGISRTPVREAVQRLEHEGLVEIMPRVGVRVRRITPEEASDVYSLKSAIEPLAARWAAERSAEQVPKRLEPLITRMSQAAEDEDVLAYADLIEGFHHTLIELARAPALEDVWATIRARVHWLRHMNLAQPGRIGASLRQHERVAEAVASGDGEAAFAAMLDHMRDAHRSALNAVKASVEGADES